MNLEKVLERKKYILENENIIKIQIILQWNALIKKRNL